LLEVLVAVVLLGLLLAGMYALLVASLRSWVFTANASELQQGTLTAASRLSWELAESNGGSFRVGTSPAGIVFASPRDSIGHVQYDATGSLLWRSYVCYFVGTVQSIPCMLRSEEPLGTPTAAPPSIPTTFTTAYFQSRPGSRIVGYRVSGFGVSGTNPLDVTLSSFHATLGKDEQTSVQLRITMRN